MDKYNKRLHSKAEAERSEYTRLVAENKELRADIARLREKHPYLPFANLEVHIKWIESVVQKAEARADELNLQGKIPIPEYDELEADITALAQKHGALKWRTGIHGLALFDKANPYSYIVFSYGLPGFKFDYNPDGQRQCEIVIPSDFDTTNPISLAALKDLKRHFTPPPQPVPDKHNPKKNDWRPVWEWEQRNPEFTRAEIAEMLDRDPVDVRRRLLELDYELSPDK